MRTLIAHLTPAKAAQVKRVSRSTISRALKSGELRGIRDNIGHWRIDPDDLEQWSNTVHAQPSVHTAHRDSEPPPSAVLAMEKMKAALERLEAAEHRATVAEQRAETAEKDRDYWRDHAKELTAVFKQSRWRWPWSS
ncbi:helix-turn-helix domain-containing protein [Sulfitobacter pontiacus]|uniref:helix-turn-helix domain-containing protein n=1 Tax=Sulfitobacter pontiacus TaxID=60137 RepID=UPI003C6ECF49